MADDRIPSPALPPGNRYALVVTTSAYGSPEYPDLSAPAYDAATMTAMLADPDICGFSVRTLIDRPAAEIRLAINEIFNDRDPGDVVLVYLSCHGVKDRSG